MDIVKGSLDDISRPATASRSRPASQISSLEVLTPESSISQWELIMDTDDDDDEEELASPGFQETPQSFLGISSKRDLEKSQPTNPTGEPETDDDLQKESRKNTAPGLDERPQTLEDRKEDSSDPSPGTEEKLDPKLEKAMKRMQALDEVLRGKMEKEKEVKAQTLAIRKQLWEELQLVTQSSGCSHEEVVNTISFLALTPQMDDVLEDSAAFEKTFLPLFSTQLPPDELDADPEAFPDTDRGTETSDGLNSREISQQRTKQKKTKASKKGVNFIQRNIQLAKDAGSHVLLMDDEKLRLEQLLGDIQDGWSDDDVTADFPLCLVPGNGYTPKPGELEELAKIDAELQIYSSDKYPPLFDDGGSGILTEAAERWDVLMDDLGTAEKAPGEKVLRHARELRAQKLRLMEIDQRLQDIERSSTTPRDGPRLLQSSVHWSGSWYAQLSPD